MSNPDYYDPDNDVIPQSPPLEKFTPRIAPSPSPEPVVTPSARLVPVNRQLSAQGLRAKGTRRKVNPSQSDFVLIRSMEPNRPDIARLVGERALHPDSGSDYSDSGGEGDMEDRTDTQESTPAATHSANPTAPSVAPPTALQDTAKRPLETRKRPTPPPFFHRDSVVEPDPPPRNDLEAAASPSTSPANGIAPNSEGVDTRPRLSEHPQSASTSPRQAGILLAPRSTNGYPHERSSATSPNLTHLRIPQSERPSSETLPALQSVNPPLGDGSVGSPNQRLPGFRHLSELAEAASNEQQDTSRANGFPHRQSISSSTQSPTSIVRQPSIASISSARSPRTPYAPLNAASPNGEAASKPDLFLHSGQSHHALFSPRRPSQASDSPYSAAPHSASTPNDYTSSDGLSPGSHPPGVNNSNHRSSIDTALVPAPRITLPPPNGTQIQHVPPHGSGGFKCDHPGCTAAPFQTQYLLKYVLLAHTTSPWIR